MWFCLTHEITLPLGFQQVSNSSLSPFPLFPGACPPQRRSRSGMPSSGDHGTLANQLLPGTALGQQEQECPLTPTFFHSLFRRQTGLWMGVRSCPRCGPCHSSFTEWQQWDPQWLKTLLSLPSIRNLRCLRWLVKKTKTKPESLGKADDQYLNPAEAKENSTAF